MSAQKPVDNGMAKDAASFAGMINDPEIGGSSYHVLSRQFLDVGNEEAHMVGGHSYAGTNTRIPESIHKQEISPEQAHAHFIRTAIHTGGDSRAYAGGWRETNDKTGEVSYVLDSSTRTPNREAAIPLAQKRGEREIFDSKNIESYKTPGVKEGTTNTAPVVEGPTPTVTRTPRGSTFIEAHLRAVRA